MKSTSYPIGPLCTKYIVLTSFHSFLASKQFFIIYKLIINILNQMKSCSSPSLPLCSLFHRIPQVGPLSSSPIQSFQLRFRSETRTHTAMAEKEKVTTMELKVDLQCHKCYKKVKKVLCEFGREIREQTYDEKQNLVVIKVVCCSPEKIRDKICFKGGGVIKCIEIKEPEKPKPPSKPVDPPPNPGPALVPVGHCHPPPKPVNVNACCVDCYHGHPGGPCQTGYGRVALYIQYDGYYGRPVCYSCGGGRSCNCGCGRSCNCGCGRSCNTNYCVARSDCFSEENPQGCTVM